MFETLTEKLLETIRALGGKMVFTEEVLDEVCRQLRRNLLEADVNVKVVKDFIEAVRAKCIGSEVKKGLSPEQQFIRVVYEELTQLMGGKATPLNFQVRPPAVFMVAGLQGAGKTTTVAKLAQFIREKEKKTVMVASIDIYRPAALEQLRTAVSALKVDYFDSPVIDSARHRATLAKEQAIRLNVDVLLLDTAGRLHVDEEMMSEIEDVSEELDPTEILLVLDAMTGQDAVQIASTFHERLPLTGVVLTKLDGDARGGAALSVRSVTGCPIKFVGTGEKTSDFETFHPDRLASRILDMGDLLSLAEKAQSALDPAESLKLAKKVKKNDFTLADFYVHLQQIKKMGSLENLMRFLPGMGQIKKQLKDMSPPETELRKIEAIILSMTPEERINHAVLDGSRRKRIASGSGTKVEDINRLIKQFLEARKMMSRLGKKSAMGKRMRM